MAPTSLLSEPARVKTRDAARGGRWLSFGLALTLAAIWATSACFKLGVPRAVELYGVIRDVFPFLPARWVERFALALPWMEFALAAGLALRLSRRWAALGSFLLLAGFTVFLVKAWIMGYENSCGCFGSVTRLTAEEARAAYGLAVLRNLVLGGLCFAIWRLSTRRRRAPRLLRP